jgi:hypothetical protein
MPQVVPVTVKNFPRAESDMYFAKAVQDEAFGRLNHNRTPVAIDKQDVIRMNRDTLYSKGVFDLDAGPVTIALPDTGTRFMSLLVINEDHYTQPVVYAPDSFTFTREQAGTRYMFASFQIGRPPHEDPTKPHCTHDSESGAPACYGRAAVAPGIRSR